jgi:hypothetical protein
MPFQATLMLADSAQAVDNKLYILGGGWSITGPNPIPSAIALNLKVPWDQANMTHHLRLELVDSDGQPVTVADAEGHEQPLVIESDIEVGRPAGLTAGTPIDLSLAINLAPLPLPPGGRYEWRLTIGDESNENWRAAFSTRPVPPGWQWPAGGEPAGG